MTNIQQTFNHYRSLIYVTVILIMAFQFYIIWQDRLDYVTIAEYSYKSDRERPIDRQVFDGKILSISEYVNAEIQIKDKTKREDVFIRSVLILRKDKETRIWWIKQ
jgi:hypothetical protein